MTSPVTRLNGRVPARTLSIATVVAAIVVLSIAYALCRVRLVDDGFDYMTAARAPAVDGRIDLSPTGFHGASILAAPVYAATGSMHAVAWLGIAASLACPVLLWLVARRVCGDRAAVVAPLLYLVLPTVIWEPMKGHISPVFALFILLTAWLAARGSAFAPLAWGYGIIVKPFAVSIAPLFLPDALRRRRVFAATIIGCLIPVAYVAATWAQTGQLTTAYTAAAGASGVGNSLSLNLPANAARTFLNLFVAGDWNLRDGYGTVRAIAPPSLVVIGAWALWQRRRDPWARRAAAAVAVNIAMMLLLNHLFAKYLLPAVLLLAIAATAEIGRRPWLALVVAADAFQLAYLRARLMPPDTVAAIPAAVPVLLPWAAAAAAAVAAAFLATPVATADPVVPTER